MKLIVGLGNPGRKYKKTRHNIGFFVIDELLHRNKWKLNNSKFEGDYAMEHVDGEKVILLQPQTFMNLSGKSIGPLMDYFNIDIDDVLIVYDDLDLPTGKIRLRQKGGHGGHNGVRSTIDHLGTKDFKRVRLGIGRPMNATPVIDYVLGNFPKQESSAVTESVEKAADAIETWVKGKPFLEVMNDFNQ